MSEEKQIRYDIWTDLVEINMHRKGVSLTADEITQAYFRQGSTNPQLRSSHWSENDALNWFQDAKKACRHELHRGGGHLYALCAVCFIESVECSLDDFGEDYEDGESMIIEFYTPPLNDIYADCGEE